tara:strand:+ start:1208 stop:1507 length:300 start_codon:yes stop_codon:yes gene_type:complete
MTVYIEKPAVNLREELASLRNQGGYHQEVFWFTGDASETDFALERGWKPKFVHDAGALQKEGSGDDYTVSYDGFIYTVVFSTAPGNGNDVGIIAEREGY